MKELICLCQSMESHSIQLERSQEDLATILVNLKSLVHFESQRVLIQEIGMVAGSKPREEPSTLISQVNEYLQDSIALFQGDSKFYHEFRGVLKCLPCEEIRQPLCEDLMEEWTAYSRDGKEDTSSRLQDKCRTVFLLSQLCVQRLTLIDTLLAALDQLDFSVKYPI
jgi:hypothetical protein